MKIKLIPMLILMVFALISNAADWDGIPVPATADSPWELQSEYSDDFNYNGKSNSNFTSRWNDSYHNAWTGPGLTYWQSDHSNVANGKLEIRASRSTQIDDKLNIPMVDCGVVTSKTKIKYPFYAEISMKVMNQTLSSNFWMLSETDRQELDVIECYGSDRPDHETQSRHMNSAWHIFDRDPETNEIINNHHWQRDHFLPSNAPLRDGYHRYGVHLIDAWHIQWYLDGQLVRTTSPESTETPIDAIADPVGFAAGDFSKMAMYEEMFLIIDVEDHDWRSDAGIISTDAELANNSKNKMYVDWVRVYKPRPIPVTGISINTSSVSLRVGDIGGVTGTVSPSNATDKSVTYTSNNTSVATVDINGFITAKSTGSATINVKANDGGYSRNCSVTVTGNTNTTFTVQAEDFANTGGTFDDGTVPLGVNKVAGTGINYVNNGDWVTYNFNVSSAGTYEIRHYISTVNTSAQVKTQIDGSTVSTDNVANNGSWENYYPLKALNTVNLSTGSHTMRLEASSATQWQWNLDRITFTKTGATGSSSGGSSSGGSSSGGSSSGGSSSGGSSSSGGTITTISGNTSVIEAESLNATGGTFNDGQVSGGGVNVSNNSINWVNAGDWAEYAVNATENATYRIVYSISTPMDNAQVRIKRDGTTISTDNVTNNGAWDSYQNLTAANNMSLTTGNHTIRIEASGSNNWQWNMDKITLNKVTGSSSSGGSSSGGSSSGGSSSGGSSSGGSSSGSGITASFANPSNNQSFAAPASVYVKVNASDNNGSISNVRMHINNTFIRQENVSPYEWNAASQNDPALKNLAAGTYTLRADVTDNSGNTESISRNFTVTGSSSSSGGSSSGGSSSGGSSSGGSSSGATTNLALNKPATQSSNYNSNFPASKAVDGTRTGTDGDFNHTQNNANAWWQVDLQSVSNITTIQVYNRTNCCQNRLTNFHVFVSDVPFSSTNLNTTINQSGVGNYHTSGQAGSPTTINVNRSGRYVRVQLAGTNFLHMAEVVVNGTAGTGSSSSGGSSSGGSSSGCSGTVITVEAENLSDHGGTYNDGHVPVGVGVAAGVGINWVNNGDWAEYNVNVPATGTYQLVYNIGTPLANRSIKMLVDGADVGTTSVPNTGNWETYQNVTASSNVSLTAGNRVIRVESGTTDTWTWNLDKFTLSCAAKEATESVTADLADMKIYPNPANDMLNIELATQAETNAQLILYNSVGRSVLSDQISDAFHQVSVDELLSGMYILQVINGNNIITERFIKE